MAKLKLRPFGDVAYVCERHGGPTHALVLKGASIRMIKDFSMSELPSVYCTEWSPSREIIRLYKWRTK